MAAARKRRDTDIRLVFDRLSDDALLDDSQARPARGTSGDDHQAVAPGRENPAVRVAERRPEVQGRRHQAVAAGDPYGSLARSPEPDQDGHGVRR